MPLPVGATIVRHHPVDVIAKRPFETEQELVDLAHALTKKFLFINFLEIHVRGCHGMANQPNVFQSPGKGGFRQLNEARIETTFDIELLAEIRVG